MPHCRAQELGGKAALSSEDEDYASLAKMSADLWKAHVLNDHVPFSKHCVTCLKGGGKSRQHRKVPHPDAMTLSLDACIATTNTPAQPPTEILPPPTLIPRRVALARQPVTLRPSTELASRPPTKLTPITQAFAGSSTPGRNHTTLPPSLHKTSSKSGWITTQIRRTQQTPTCICCSPAT